MPVLKESEAGLYTGMSEMCKDCSSEFTRLSGFRVVLGITGSISVYRIPDLVRDLVREGAEVRCGLSEAAQSLVSDDVFEWASGFKAVTRISGKIEHISLFTEPDKTVLLIAPATYNFIGKIANGIADTVPTLFFSYAFGKSVKVILSPAMHESMLKNPVLTENIERLHSLGVSFVQPKIEEEKAKIADYSYLIDSVYRSFFGSKFSGKRALVIGGHGEEPLDPVRVITNRSTGDTGYWLARNLYRLGCEQVTLVGNTPESLPPYVDFIPAVNTDQFYSLSLREAKDGDYDYIFLPAALTDFSVSYSKTKIKSGDAFSLDLTPRKKLLTELRDIFSGEIVSFKLDHEEPSPDNLSDFIVFNRIVEKGSNFGEVPVDYRIIDPSGTSRITAQTKEEGTWKILLHVSVEGRR